MSFTITVQFKRLFLSCSVRRRSTIERLRHILIHSESMNRHVSGYVDTEKCVRRVEMCSDGKTQKRTYSKWGFFIICSCMILVEVSWFNRDLRFEYTSTRTTVFNSTLQASHNQFISSYELHSLPKTNMKSYLALETSLVWNLVLVVKSKGL